MSDIESVSLWLEAIITGKVNSHYCSILIVLCVVVRYFMSILVLQSVSEATVCGIMMTTCTKLITFFSKHFSRDM